MTTRRFYKGDRIYLEDAHYLPSGLVVGMRGTVADSNDYASRIKWDNPPEGTVADGWWFNYRFAYLHDEEDTTSAKSEDPRTDAKRYNDSVDDLLRSYAEKMKKGFDNETMVYPYSHLGLLAEFLMDFQKLEKP